MIRVFEKSNPDFQRRLDALCNRSSELSADIEAAARKTIAQVRAEGDAALRALTAEFDKRELDAIELPAAEWDELAARTTPDVRAAIERAAQRVRTFHERERYASYEISEDGVRVGSRVDPLGRIGIYVPGAPRVLRDLRGRHARRQPRRRRSRASASTSRAARRAIRRR